MFVIFQTDEAACTRPAGDAPPGRRQLRGGRVCHPLPDLHAGRAGGDHARGQAAPLHGAHGMRRHRRVIPGRSLLITHLQVRFPGPHNIRETVLIRE